MRLSSLDILSMSHSYQLIWFRQDLRIHDHTALWHATQAGQCIALVILSPEQWQQHDDAPIKIEFYLRQLQQLKQQLNTLNIPLIIQHIPLWKDVGNFFTELLQRINIENVYANIELGVNELKRDHDVQKVLNQQPHILTQILRSIFTILFGKRYSQINTDQHQSSLILE